MVFRSSGGIFIFIFLITVTADDYLSDFESNSVSSSNVNSYNSENSFKTAEEGNLNSAVVSTSVEQGGYVESPLNIPTIPPLPPPPGPSTNGQSGGCGESPSSAPPVGCGGAPVPIGGSCGGGVPSPCGGSPCSGGCGNPSPCSRGCGNPSPCSRGCGNPSPCGSPCSGGHRPCGGPPFIPQHRPCGGCGGCQSLRPCLPKPPCIRFPPVCPPPPLCPPPTICPPPPPPCHCQRPPPPPCGFHHRPPLLIPGNCGSGGCGRHLPQNDCCCNCHRPCGGGHFARARGVRINPRYSNYTQKNAMCNSIRLREVIREAISNDPDESKRVIQNLAQRKFGRAFNVICGEGEFSYLTHTTLYCQYTMQKVTCYAFQTI